MFTKIKQNILFYTRNRVQNRVCVRNKIQRSVHTKSSGFTLIELMVVLSIIAVLATLIMSSLNSSRQKAMDAQIKSDLSQVRNALELYVADNGFVYPLISSLAKNSEHNSGQKVVSGSADTRKTSIVGSISSIASVKTAYAANRNQNCVYFDNLVSVLVPSYIGRIPTHPMDDGADVCYKYFSDVTGQKAVAYGPLVTEQFDIGTNKQVGIALGKVDIDSLKSVCQDNIVVAGTPFPLFSGADHCDGPTIADEVLGITAGEGQLELIPPSYACSLSQYTSQQECEQDRSYCSDSNYTDQSSCESNGSYSGGYCSTSGYYDQSSCEGAGYTGDGSCSAWGYYDQSSCEGAGYTSSSAYCSGGGYYDQSSCEGAGYTSSSAYCSAGGYYDQSSCENAGYNTDGSCSAGGYYDQSSCEGAGYYSDYYYCSDSSYGDQWSCENAGYSWSYGGQNFYSYGYTWTPGGWQSYGYTWYPEQWTSYGYTWYPDQWTSYGYTWTPGSWQTYGYTWNPGDLTPNTWTSVPGGTWNEI